MKRLFFFMMALVVLSACKRHEAWDQSDPTDALRSFLRAADGGDYDTVVSFLCPQYRQTLESSAEKLNEQLKLTGDFRLQAKDMLRLGHVFSNSKDIAKIQLLSKDESGSARLSVELTNGQALPIDMPKTPSGSYCIQLRLVQ